MAKRESEREKQSEDNNGLLKMSQDDLCARSMVIGIGFLFHSKVE